MMPPLLKGMPLNSNWVSAFFLPVGILITKCFFCRLDETQLLKHANRLVWITQAAILIFFFVGGVIYPAVMGRKATLLFPGQALTDKVSEIWRRQHKEPLTIVISDPWIGGNVLLHARPEPTLLIDNNPEISPWVNANDVAACGAFIIINKSEADAYSLLFSQASAKGELSFAWGRPPLGIAVHYMWAIKPPITGEATCRFTASPDYSGGK